MKLDTIGKNIRKFRLARKLRQEDLAEKTDLTTNYIGMVERGEKIPSLETFIKIVNALGVSSDMVLTDVLETGYTVKNSMLNEKLEKLAPEDRNRIYEVIDTLVKQSKQTQKFVLIGELSFFRYKKFLLSTNFSGLRQREYAITTTVSDRHILIDIGGSRSERHFQTNSERKWNNRKSSKRGKAVGHSGSNEKC